MRKAIQAAIYAATAVVVATAALPAQEAPGDGGSGPGLLVITCNEDRTYTCGNNCADSPCHWCCATCP